MSERDGRNPKSRDFAGVVLAGGAGRRMGGASKPALTVGGTALLSRVLAALDGAEPRVVVGPPALSPLLPAGVARTSERPPGGGPVAATAAGLAYLAGAGFARTGTRIALFASDLPFLSADTVTALAAAAEAGDGAVLVDATGRPQWLAGVWRLSALARRLDELGSPAGRGMGELLAGLRTVTIEAPSPSGPPAWFDCDTEDDLRQAEEWTRDA